MTTPGGSHQVVFGDSFISEVVRGDEDSQDQSPDISP
jgi:hypothetical protein